MPRTHSPHHYTTTNLDWHEAGCIHGFTLLAPNSDPTICTPQQKLRFIRPGYIFPVSFNCPLQPQLSVIGREKRNQTWSSAVVAQLPQGSMCCAFWDAFLLTNSTVFIWVTVVFLSALTSLPIFCWHLSSKRHFCPHDCHSLDVFFFLPTILSNL